jgi:hypothetical protein
LEGEVLNNSHLALALSAALSLAPAAAHAQATLAPVSATAMPMVVGAPTQTAMLRAGTSVPLRTITALTTNGKTLKVGQRFDLETTEAVSVNGQVVIPAGSRAVGEITDVRNKGMWGKSGRIGARLIYVQANDRRLRLSGSMDDKGVTGTGGVVAAAVLVPVVGFFVTGTSAEIAAGSNTTGFLEEDVPVAFASAPAPMVVQPAVAAPIAAPAGTSLTVSAAPAVASAAKVIPAVATGVVQQ